MSKATNDLIEEADPLPHAAPGLMWTESYQQWEDHHMERLRQTRAARLAHPVAQAPEPSEAELMARAAQHRWIYERAMREKQAREARGLLDLSPYHITHRCLTPQELASEMPPREELYHLHQELHMTPLALAAHYGVPDLLIYVWLDERGVGLRKRSAEELQRLAARAKGGAPQKKRKASKTSKKRRPQP